MTPPRAGRRQLETAAAKAVGALAGVLPWHWAQRVGRVVGAIWARLDPRHVAIAVDALGHAFPAWDRDRRRRTALAVYRHFAQVLLEILWMRRRSREEILRLTDVEGREHVAAALAPGRGAVLVTAHFGNWELHGLVHGWTFGQIGVIARPLDNPALDRMLVEARESSGNVVIYKRRALASVIKLLRGGRGVAVLMDQNTQDGDFVGFFGRPAATTTVAAALALKTGCALLPCRAVRRGDGRYRVVYDAPLGADQDAPDRAAEILRLTQALTSRIEAWVREDPEQWLWIHRRWKTQPPVVPSVTA